MNPYQKQQQEYLKTKVQTASKEQLVLMLMDGVVRFSEQGRKAIADGDIEKKQFALIRSQDIIVELVNGLDHEQGGEISTNLARLYTYAIKRLVDANLKEETEGIDEVQHIFRNLREAWSIAMDKAASENKEQKGTFDTATADLSGAQPKVDLSSMPKTLKKVDPDKKPPEDRPRLSIQG